MGAGVSGARCGYFAVGGAPVAAWALSVGDGDFARRSFDRIIALKESGVTILFCSHSLYYVEALCSRALWLEQGRVRMLDNAAVVIAAYQAELDGVALQELRAAEDVAQAAPPATASGSGSARIVGFEAGQKRTIHGE